MPLSDNSSAPAAPTNQEAAEPGPTETQRPIAQRAAEEAKRYLAFAAYLLIVLGTLILFSLNIYARLDEAPQRYSSYHFYGLGLINALVLAKFMLVAETTKLGSFAVGRRLQQEPLAFQILYRAVLFAAVLTAAYMLEEVLVGAWHGKAIREVLPDIAGGPRGLITFTWVMFVALVPYFAYRELSRALGETRLRSLLWGSRAAL